MPYKFVSCTHFRMAVTAQQVNDKSMTSQVNDKSVPSYFPMVRTYTYCFEAACCFRNVKIAVSHEAFMNNHYGLYIKQLTWLEGPESACLQSVQNCTVAMTCTECLILVTHTNSARQPVIRHHYREIVNVCNDLSMVAGLLYLYYVRNVHVRFHLNTATTEILEI